MTTVSVYINKWNAHKFIEVHNDGYRHNTVRQFLYRPVMSDKTPSGKIIWKMELLKIGGNLHRWRKANLEELLDDYELVDFDKIQRELEQAVKDKNFELEV